MRKEICELNTLELKNSFHDHIDRIENENLLMTFYDLMSRRASTNDGQLWNRLTKEEQEELFLSLEEIKDPKNLVCHDQVKKKHKKWL